VSIQYVPTHIVRQDLGRFVNIIRWKIYGRRQPIFIGGARPIANTVTRCYLRSLLGKSRRKAHYDHSKRNTAPRPKFLWAFFIGIALVVGVILFGWPKAIDQPYKITIAQDKRAP
jgi:hypothetical protein